MSVYGDKKIRKTIYASVSLEFISEHYLYCLYTMKNKMNGGGMVELVGDS